MTAELRSYTLNIRLLREGKSPNQSFFDTFSPGSQRALEVRSWDGIEDATLYIGQIYSSAPEWTKFLKDKSPNIPDYLSSSGAGAALFVPVDGRIMAICFGQIHIALDDNAFERQFGLRVTLNSVPRNQLRTLDLATPDAITFQKRVQASRDSDVQAFGVDILRDLARVAGGTPKLEKFAKFIAGKDALSITCMISPETLLSKCHEVYKYYISSEYKKDYKWIDNLRIVEDKDQKIALDLKLAESLRRLREGHPSELHMSPPEIVDYRDGEEIHYNGFGSHGVTFHSLSIDDYVKELERCGFKGDFDEVKKKHKIRSKKTGSDKFKDKWRVYDCFVFEVTMGNGKNEAHYVLFAGKWYCVEKRFKDGVERFFKNAERVEIIGKTTCVNEEELISNVEANRSDLLKLDQEKINPGGVIYANLEPCDFLSMNGDFIHLKDGDSSGPISHVWMQGVVSAEALVRDEEFRRKLREKVKGFGRGFESTLPRAVGKVDRKKYKVVYGIMRKPYKDGSLDIPFFSKVSFQAASQRVEHMGLSVAIEIIEKPKTKDDEDTDEIG